MLVPRDLPQVSATTTDTNFKLYDSCMPYMGMQQKPDTNSCFAKLRAISNLFSFFFIHPVYISICTITLLHFGVVEHSAELLMGVYYSDNAQLTSLVVV
jgi:hypothetical protein